MKILCIGACTYDIFVTSEYFPQENTKNTFVEKKENGGGLIPNAAYFLSGAGIETYIATSIGSDDFGNVIKKELENAGAKVDYVETGYTGKTNIALYLYNKQNKTTTVYNVDGGVTLKKYSFSIMPDYILLDGSDYGASRGALDKYKEVKSILVIDTPTKENLDLSKYANFIVLSSSAAESISNIKFDYGNSNSLVEVYSNLKQKFSNSEIIINIAGYGVLYLVNNEVKIMPSLNNIERVDFTGEMDSFVAGLTYGFANSFDIEKSVTYGIISGSLATTKLGARLSIPRVEEVVNFYNTKFNVQTASTTPVAPVAAEVQPAPVVETPEVAPVEAIVNENVNK